MKTIEIEDKTYDDLKALAEKAGRSIAETAGIAFARLLPSEAVANAMLKYSDDMNSWKKERGFGKNGKGISRPIR